MPPSRTHDRSQTAEGSRSKTTSRPKHRNNPVGESTSIPGVQKVKTLLRQTRRLLAKDNLAANVRVETERRLKALEAELVQAEQAKKERTLSIKYHKVKFFERQKVTRKLKQARKRLEKADSSGEKETIAGEIHELNVDLNYILHYPRTKKYISLFPPVGQKTDGEREKVREWIREQMTNGELPGRARRWTEATEGLTAEDEDDGEQDAFFGEDV